MFSLVLTFIKTVTFVGSATEPRSRRDDESMQGHRRGEATKRWARPAPTLRADGGCGRSLCPSSSSMSLHRLFLSSRPRLASPIRKRHRIDEREYLASANFYPYSCIIKPMPIFEYQCSDCESKFEKIVLGQSTDVQCPDCSSAHIEKLLSSFAVSTGSTRTSSAQAERACGRGNFT